MLIDKPLFSELVNEIDEFTKNSIFIAHNVNFDYRVLKDEFHRCQRKFIRKTLCTIELSKNVFPNENSYSLGKLVSSLGIEIKNRHRADGDAEATLKLFNKICFYLNRKELINFVRINK
jgi:DNA polymerase-3 subunit epsilon